MFEIKSSTYINLPAEFYQTVLPNPISQPNLVKFNTQLASSIGINKTPSVDDILMYAGNCVPEHLTSIALAYAGDQFGHYTPRLGDGRAILLGETCVNDQCWDVQLKGSGRTAFSRSGDGRAPLSAVIREYLMSEAMHGLGIPTTRGLAIISSDDKILRANGLVPMGVLTRVASSFLRVGSFQYAAHLDDHGLLKLLVDYAVKRHLPQYEHQNQAYHQLFQFIVDSQARLITDWMGVGFIHGVMNTDNMAISGETIDYGPCAFMDEFHINQVFSSIDVAGRYAFNNQAQAAYWNLGRLYDALKPLCVSQTAQDELQNILDTFPQKINHYWMLKISSKLGLVQHNAQTPELIEGFLLLLQEHKPDYTNTFRLLSEALVSDYHRQLLLDAFGHHAKSQQWLSAWLACITQQNSPLEDIKLSMENVNPAYIPRNHLIEKAIQHYIQHNDLSVMDELLHLFKQPYAQQPNTTHLQRLPEPHERITQTFCGT